MDLVKNQTYSARHMRARLSLSVCAILMLSCWLGCRQDYQQELNTDSRWTVPPKLVIASSFHDLTNDFAKHNTAFHITVEVTSNPNFAALSRYAHSGIRAFETYCYERIEGDFWHLRSVMFFHASDSMKVEALATNGAVDFVHDGVTLFSVYGASNQVQTQSEARLLRNQVKP